MTTRRHVPREVPKQRTCIRQGLVHLCGSEVSGIDDDVFLIIKVQLLEDLLNEFADRVGFPGGNNKIIWLILLEDKPHSLHVIPGEPPVPLRLQIT